MTDSSDLVPRDPQALTATSRMSSRALAHGERLFRTLRVRRLPERLPHKAMFVDAAWTHDGQQLLTLQSLALHLWHPQQSQAPHTTVSWAEGDFDGYRCTTAGPNHVVVAPWSLDERPLGLVDLRDGSMTPVRLEFEGSRLGSLCGVEASLSGRRLLVQCQPDGEHEAWQFVLDLRSGQLLDARLSAGNACWLPNETILFWLHEEQEFRVLRGDGSERKFATFPTDIVDVVVDRAGAVTYVDCEAQIWRLDQGARLPRLAMHLEDTRDWWGCATIGTKAIVWHDWPDRTCLQRIDTAGPVILLESGDYRRPRFSPTDDVVAIVGRESGVRLYDTHDGKLCSRLDVPSTEHFEIAVDRTSTRLATNANDGVVRLFDGASGEPECTWRLPMVEDLDYPCPEAIGFSPDGRTLFTTCGGLPFFETWCANLESGVVTSTGTLRLSPHAVAFAPSSDRVIMVSTFVVRLAPHDEDPWDPQCIVGDILLGPSDDLPELGLATRVHDVCFLDRETLLFATESGLARVPCIGGELEMIDGMAPWSGQPFREGESWIVANAGPGCAVAGGPGGEVSLVRGARARAITSLEGPVTCLDCSPNTGTAVALSGNKGIVFDVETGDIRNISAPFEPRGVTVCDDGAVVCWDAGGQLATLDSKLGLASVQLGPTEPGSGG